MVHNAGDVFLNLFNLDATLGVDFGAYVKFFDPFEFGCAQQLFCFLDVSSVASCRYHTVFSAHWSAVAVFYTS